MHLFAIRKIIKCSDTTRPKLEQDYIKKRMCVKKEVQIFRRAERMKALKYFNDDKL
jgi:hypothetical protein